MSTVTPVLEVEDLVVNYGRVEALRGLSLTVGEGETVSLLGNNGAGKSTTVATISGLVRATSGRIRAFGKEITAAKPWELVEMGIVHVPEGRRIFPRLSVHENLLIGGYTVRDSKAIEERIQEVYELLPRLRDRRNQHGGTLSGGEQQMLAMGRAMIAAPRLLMLDEPSMGLAPLMVAQIMQVVRTINERGTAVLLIEQNARSALTVATRGYVLEAGVTSLEGSSEELRTNPRVVEAYLGA
ncbi:ABC transporter ATP-binding protein [Nocardia sp. NEAU-G5]|uniref:ABC transporter ATP-binding protein n=1 Tax=Nocardia albiluteola TaxID=2842303 RepID=A0ABS6B069_9NOCA|nr:ABC transporter ATP-binding protein [Nocardia albiluteola]MBU3063687.1 ABC transporter ATP-binding protein [Nocardia albiluteola]